MGLWKDVNLYFSFTKTLKENEYELEKKFNLRIDNAGRLYTILNIPPELFEEPYNIRKGDIDLISENYIKEFTIQLGQYLDSKGLKELYKFDEPITKKAKYSYLLVIGFSRVDSRSIMKSIYWLIGLSVFTLLTFLFFFL
jgi:hypothetical protein